MSFDIEDYLAVAPTRDDIARLFDKGSCVVCSAPYQAQEINPPWPGELNASFAATGPWADVPQNAHTLRYVRGSTGLIEVRRTSSPGTPARVLLLGRTLRLDCRQKYRYRPHFDSGALNRARPISTVASVQAECVIAVDNPESEDSPGLFKHNLLVTILSTETANITVLRIPVRGVRGGHITLGCDTMGFTGGTTPGLDPTVRFGTDDDVERWAIFPTDLTATGERFLVWGDAGALSTTSSASANLSSPLQAPGVWDHIAVYNAVVGSPTGGSSTLEIDIRGWGGWR